MRIVDVRETTVPIASPIRNAFIDFSKMTCSLVAVVTDAVVDGEVVVGYGFHSNGRYAQGGLMEERFIPRLRQADPHKLLNDAGDNLDPERIWATMMSNEKPGGHGERSVAVGAIDMAVWDATAKIARKPLFRLLAEQAGRQPNPKVFIYSAGGYYQQGKGVKELRAEMRCFLDSGYAVVKMKIGNGIEEDKPRIEGVLEELDGKAKLAVDANGKLDRKQALEYAKALEKYPLFWFEEPGDPLDFDLQKAVAEAYSGNLATGENLFSHQDARNLLRYGGMRKDRDWLQFDPALAYGLTEYRRTLEVVKDEGWDPSRCIPHGGHQMALNIAAGLGLGGNEIYPGLFQPFGGFPDSVKVENSWMTMPELPGIGFEGKAALIGMMRQLI